MAHLARRASLEHMSRTRRTDGAESSRVERCPAMSSEAPGADDQRSHPAVAGGREPQSAPRAGKCSANTRVVP